MPEIDTGAASRYTAALDSVRGGTCWAVFYGPSTGVTIHLQFEPKVARSEPLMNRAVTDDERKFDSEYVLYVSCAWRLATTDRVLCCSGDALPRLEKLAQNLELLVGEHLVALHTGPPGWDAALAFTSGLHLRIFCDQPEERDNYDFFTPTDVFTVGPGSKIASERREFV